MEKEKKNGRKPTRSEARQIAQKITFEQIKAMLTTAKSSITDWTSHSRLNKTLSKGMTWNIMTKALRPDMHILVKTNLVMEYGEYLPEELRLSEKPRKTFPIVAHANPIDLNF